MEQYTPNQQTTSSNHLSSTGNTPLYHQQPPPYNQNSISGASNVTANGRIEQTTKNTNNRNTNLPMGLENSQNTLNTNTPTYTWQEYQTVDGRKYYHNRVTGVTQWERPADMIEPASTTTTTTTTTSNTSSPIPLSSVWKEYTDDKGRKYYYNTQTQLTQWEVPTEFLSKRSFSSSQKPQQLPATPSVSQDQQQSKSDAADNTTTTPAEEGSKNESGDLKPMKPIDNVEWKEEKEKVSPAPVKVAQTYKTKGEAYDAFWQLLEETHIGDDWDWETTMKKIITDPRYAALRTHRERRDAFHRYIERRRKKQDEEYRVKKQKARKEFLQMLEETPQITAHTRMFQAEQILGHDERWRFLDDERERKELLHDHISKLRRKERQEAREKFIQVLEEKAEEGTITASSSLHRIRDKIDEDLYRSLDRDDLVDVWKVFSRKLRRKEDEEKEKERYKRRKQERKDRDAFLQMLRDLSSQGRITVQTKWKDIEQELADNEVMQAMKKSTRYNPRELFDDNMEQLEEQYKLDKRRIKTVAADAGLSVTSTTTFDEFTEALSQDSRTKSVDQQTLRIIFDDLQQRAIHREERRREKQIDRFKELLKKNSDITTSTTWEQIRPSLADYPEFTGLEPEEERIRLFERYIAKLKRKEERRLRKREQPTDERQESSNEKDMDVQPPAAKKARITNDDAHNNGDPDDASNDANSTNEDSPTSGASKDKEVDS